MSWRSVENIAWAMSSCCGDQQMKNAAITTSTSLSTCVKLSSFVFCWDWRDTSQTFRRWTDDVCLVLLMLFWCVSVHSLLCGAFSFSVLLPSANCDLAMFTFFLARACGAWFPALSPGAALGWQLLRWHSKKRFFLFLRGPIWLQYFLSKNDADATWLESEYLERKSKPAER